ncbi:fibronectin type III domain-containing protein [Candidatus Woesearchaeota archaeon]|nr:fibronectin type III domain-containing protein [Candidatus Woesearchaeota archaeon]
MKFKNIFLVLFVLISIQMCFALDFSDIVLTRDSEYATFELTTDVEAKVSLTISANPDATGGITYNEQSYTTNHTILISELTPNTTYYYKFQAMNNVGSRTYDCFKSNYVDGACNVGPNFGDCLCGTGANPDCGSGSKEGWFCVNSLCREDLPTGNSPDFTTCMARNFTTQVNDTLEPFLWLEVPTGIGQYQVTLDGYTEPESKINVSLDGVFIRTATANLQGHFVMPITLTEDSKKIDIIVKDKSGRTTTKSFEFVVDVIPPQFEQTSDIPTLVGKNEFYITGTISEAVKFHYEVSQESSKKDAEIDVPAGTFNISIPLFEGRNTVFVEYYDAAGLGQKITRTPGDPRKYVQDIVSDTKAPVFKENNLGDLSQTIVPYLAAIGKVEDLTDTTVYVYGKVLDDTYLDVEFESPELNGSESQLSFHEVYSEYILLAYGTVDADGAFKVSFYLPANIDAALSLDSDSSGSDLNAEGGGSFFGAEVDLKVVAVDQLGHYSEIAGDVKYGTCADNSDWIFQIDGDHIYPEKLDPYLIEQGLAEIYIPFTVEYVGSDDLLSGLKSPTFKKRSNLGGYNKEQFDWDAIKSCSVDFTESANEGYIVCKIKPYEVPSDHEASSAAGEAGNEVEETLEEAVNNYLDFRALTLPMSFKFGYEVNEYDGDRATKTYEQCVFLNIMVDVDLINESSEAIQDAINFTLGIVDTLYNITGEVDNVLDTALRITILGSFGTTIANVIAKTNELMKCGGISKDNADYTWSESMTQNLIGGILAKPTTADMFNFRHGASGTYCEKVYAEGQSQEEKEKNPFYKSCTECRQAINGSMKVKAIDYVVSDRVYCPQVPTYQEFVRQRYLALRQAQSPYLKSSEADVLVYVTAGAGKTYGEKTITLLPDDKSYKTMPLDFECQQYFQYIVNNNDELNKKGLFPDIKEDTTTGSTIKKYSKDTTKEADALKDACVKAYKAEYDSACWASYVDDNYKASRDYQIKVLQELGVADQEEEDFTKKAVEFISALGDLSSTVSKMCTMESLNNSVYKELVESDREIFANINTINGFPTFDNMLKDIKNKDASYGFLVKGAKVYFIQASSDVVITGDGNTGEIARTNLNFNLEGCDDSFSLADLTSPTGSGKACVRLYVNKYGCAFTTRLPESVSDTTNIETNPNFFYPNTKKTHCLKGDSGGQDIAANQVAVGTQGYIGVLPERVFDKVIFEGGKTVLRDPTKGFFTSVSCGCLSGARANVQRWHTYLGYMKNCLEAAQGAGSIQDAQCYEMFAEQLCDSMYALVSCVTGLSGTQGANMDFSGGRGETNAVSAFFSATASSGRESQDRYGASYSSVMDMTTKYIVNSACYGFLGLPLPDDLSLWGTLGMLSDQATDQIILEPIATFMRARGSYYGVNKNLGYSRINYQFIPTLVSTAPDTRVKIELVCSSDYECSQLSSDGKCDCYGYGTDQIETLPGSSKVLDKDENFNELLVQTLERPYRFDSVRFVIDYKDSDGVMQHMETEKYPIDFNNGQSPGNCAYDETYVDSRYGGRGGYICERFSTLGSTFAFVGTPSLKYDTVYAQQSQANSVNPTANDKIIIQNLVFNVQDGNVNYDDNVEDYDYDPVAEQYSTNNGYSESKFTKYYRVRLFNEKGTALYDSGAQIIPVGEHSYSETEPKRDGQYGYDISLSDLMGGTDTMGRITASTISGSVRLTDKQISRSSQSTFTMLLKFNKTAIGKYNLTYWTNPAVATTATPCATGTKIDPDGRYCQTDRKQFITTPTVTTISGRNNVLFNDINGLRFTFEDSTPAADDKKIAYYYIEYTPQEIFQSASTSNLCKPVQYSVVLTIHNAQADGLPATIVAQDDAGQDLKKEFKVTVSCFEDSTSTDSTASGTTTCASKGGICVDRGTTTASAACAAAGHDEALGQFNCASTESCCIDYTTCQQLNGGNADCFAECDDSTYLKSGNSIEAGNEFCKDSTKPVCCKKI